MAVAVRGKEVRSRAMRAMEVKLGIVKAMTLRITPVGTKAAREREVKEQLGQGQWEQGQRVQRQ